MVQELRTKSRSQKKSLLSLYGFWGLDLSSISFLTWIYGAGSEHKFGSQNKSLRFSQGFWDLDLSSTSFGTWMYGSGTEDNKFKSQKKYFLSVYRF
jgi:hypothetical protein